MYIHIFYNNICIYKYNNNMYIYIYIYYCSMYI